MEDATYTMGSTAYNMRRRPLHTCGVAVLAITRSIFARTLEFDGPLGALNRTLAKRGSFLKPAIFALMYYWLAILSFIDDHALDAAMIISLRYPSSNHFFNQVDNAVFLVEKLPEKFDDLINKLPGILQRFPLMNRAVLCVIKWVNSLIVVLTLGAFKTSNEKETRSTFNNIAEREEFSTDSKIGADEDNKHSRRNRRKRATRRDSFVSQDRGRIEQQERTVGKSIYTEDPIQQLFVGWQVPRTGETFIMRTKSSSL